MRYFVHHKAVTVGPVLDHYKYKAKAESNVRNDIKFKASFIRIDSHIINSGIVSSKVRRVGVTLSVI